MFQTDIFFLNKFDAFTNKDMAFARLFGNNISKIFTHKEFVIFENFFISKKIPYNIQVFNFSFIDEIKNLGIYKVNEKICLVI